MFMEERQKDIISKINETGRILVSEIQEYYQIQKYTFQNFYLSHFLILLCPCMFSKYLPHNLQFYLNFFILTT